MRELGAGCLVIVVLASLGTQARADDPLAAGLGAYDHLKYAEAVGLLEQARANATRPEDQAIIARTLAFAHVALNQPDQACAEFRAWLEIDPKATLDRTISPRVREVFEQARREAALARAAQSLAAPPPLAVALSPHAPRAGQPLELTLAAPRSASAQLLYRTRGTAAYFHLTAAAHAGHLGMTVPGSGVKAPGFEYYLIALDEHGTPVAFAGSVDRPLTVDVAAPPPPRPPLYRRRWFWAVLGGSLALTGAIVGIAVGVTQAGAPAHLTIEPPK